MNRVGVNLLWLVPGVVGGSEEYTTRLLRALAEQEPGDLQVTLFALAPFAEAHPDLVATFPTVLSGLDGHHRAQRVAAESTWLARAAKRGRIELLHHAGGVVPPAPPAAVVAPVPSVLTIHDLQPLVHPENFSPVKRRWLGAMIPRSARRARLVLTPSEPASSSVRDHLGLAHDRVVTVPHGVEPPAPVSDERREAVRARYRLSGRVVLYPAITYLHKDHTTLVRAFARLATDRPDLTLVLAGGPGSAERDVTAAVRASGFGGQVRRTGRVPWGDLEALYSLATAVAVPSRFEGFGAPALEAMAAGVPVVASDATALPWVIGDGGLLVGAGDVEGWTAALASVLDAPATAERLATAGLRQARKFTWQRSGLALVDAYRQGLATNEDGTR